jgi:hypothetical protein
MHRSERRALVRAQSPVLARTRALGCLLLLLSACACSSFRTLRKEVSFMEATSIVSAVVKNADQYPDVYGLVIEWDRDRGKVLSADVTRVGDLGVFAFFVTSPINQYVMAFSDRNGNKRYDPGEPGWIHSDASGSGRHACADGCRNRAPLRSRW